MSKRRYTNMLALLPVIEQMIESGMSNRQIEDELALEGDRPGRRGHRQPHWPRRLRRCLYRGVKTNKNLPVLN